MMRLAPAVLAGSVLHLSAGAAFPASVEITILVTTASEPAVGVPARVYRKSATTEEVHHVDTDDNGMATIFEGMCTADIQYRIEAQANMRFRSRRTWRPCQSPDPISFVVQSTGVSVITQEFLNGSIPQGVRVPQSYAQILEELKGSIDDEQWGAASKLSSQLAAQYRAVNLADEGNVFSEISLWSTMTYAEAKFGDEVGTDFVYFQTGTGVDAHVAAMMTDEGGKLVRRLQADCGVAVDGVVGWQTMTCLPGGADYTLPAEVLDLRKLGLEMNTSSSE